MRPVAIALLLVGCAVDAGAHPNACDDDGACPPGRHCHRPEGVESGLCVLDEDACVATTEICNGVDDDCDGDVDEGFDLHVPERCGACDRVCTAPNSMCVPDGSGGFTCGSTCDPMRFTDCGADTCVDTSTDEAHCGGCGVRCDPGEDCVEGACRCGGVAGGEDCAGTVASTCCGTRCVDLNTSSDHCGSCNAACGMSGGARVSCAEQVCDCGDCRAPNRCLNLILMECLR
ncbi:MAG: hypothetical protein H6719_09930 [Sandaracinaceae bacterium]|nr:hypothetical protein [Sandaracinaceae bacterium]